MSKITKSEPRPSGIYTLVKVDGEAVGGIMAMPTTVPMGAPPHWGVYVTVEDVEATAKKAQELGRRP